MSKLRIEDIENMLDNAVPSLECQKEMRFLFSKLEIAINGLSYIEGFHIRGVEDQHLEVIRIKATEFLKDIRE